MVAPSQGVHVVVDREFLPGDHALLVPKTADGRVLFAVPWLGKLILGTTDTPRQDLAREPEAFEEEIEFILRESARYLSREHTVLVSRSGLVTVTGGKWTTYRAMAEDVLEKCFDAALLDRVDAGVTTHLKLVGADEPVPGRPKISDAPGLHAYGSEQQAVLSLPGAQRQLGGGLSEAMVRFAARHEYARTVEDVLARRSRLLFLDARLAGALAGEVGAILQQETGVDPQIAAFRALARRYLSLPADDCPESETQTNQVTQHRAQAD